MIFKRICGSPLPSWARPSFSGASSFRRLSLITVEAEAVAPNPKRLVAFPDFDGGGEISRHALLP